MREPSSKYIQFQDSHEDTRFQDPHFKLRVPKSIYNSKMRIRNTLFQDPRSVSGLQIYLTTRSGSRCAYPVPRSGCGTPISRFAFQIPGSKIRIWIHGSKIRISNTRFFKMESGYSVQNSGFQIPDPMLRISNTPLKNRITDARFQDSNPDARFQDPDEDTRFQ